MGKAATFLALALVACGSTDGATAPGPTVVVVQPPNGPSTTTPPTSEVTVTATPQSPELDAGTDAAADATVDAGECSAPADRCYQYQHQTCTSGAWTKIPDETCCKDTTKFVLSGSVMIDSTGRKWSRTEYTVASSDYDAATCPDIDGVAYYKAKVGQILGLIIGVGTCTPALDQSVFGNTDPGVEFRGWLGGCVDINTGVNKGTCTGLNVGYFCTADP